MNIKLSPIDVDIIRETYYRSTGGYRQGSEWIANRELENATKDKKTEYILP